MNDQDDTIQTRYSREQRLKNASPRVKALYEPGRFDSPGIFRGLVADKGSRMIFFVLLFFFGMTLFTALYVQRISKYVIDGLSCNLSAFEKEEMIYAVFTVAENPDDIVEREVYVVFTAFDVNNAVLDNHSLQAIYLGNDLRLSVHFPKKNIARISAQCIIGNSHGSMSVSVE